MKQSQALKRADYEDTMLHASTQHTRKSNTEIIEGCQQLIKDIVSDRV